jgi:hypothetical protein
MLTESRGSSARCLVAAPGLDLPATLATPAGSVRLDVVAPEALAEHVGRGAPAPAIAILGGPDPMGLLKTLRGAPECDRTRAFLIGAPVPDAPWDELDLEDALPAESLDPGALARLVERGLRAHEALGTNPLVPRRYLDARYDSIFDWFEKTRWAWDEIELGEMNPELVSDDEVAVIKEFAIGEFGTLPAIHNFLREWSDEYSFSSWAVAWGAEEARHSLVLTRYLKGLGITTMAKHAMYKREPYPIGYNRAATLMMNVISESRASEYYREMALLAREPVLRRIWQHLGHDEGRHCRAFAVFCEELCQLDPKNLVAALEMAYVFLADRKEGVKHPTGLFYPLSPSTDGLRRIESYLAAHMGDATSRADARVLSVIRKITGDGQVTSVGGIRSKLRQLM